METEFRVTREWLDKHIERIAVKRYPRKLKKKIAKAGGMYIKITFKRVPPLSEVSTNLSFTQ